MIKATTYQHYLPYVILYFFLNNIFLPHGLLYTSLLTPVFVYWLYKQGDVKNMAIWTLVLVIPIPFQLYTGVDSPTYIRSSLLILGAWIFFFTAIRAVRVLHQDLHTIFKKVLIANTVLTFVALALLPFVRLRDLMWNSIPISPNIPPFPRLDLFSYEPSHYALLLTPVFIYFVFMSMAGKLRHPLLYLMACLAPLFLTFSFGVIGGLILVVLIILIIYARRLPKKTMKAWLYGILSLVMAFILVNWLWPENPVWSRIINIISGTDTSAEGRLFNSFMFSADLIMHHNFLFGVGPGQVKVLAHDLIINYYQYSGEFAEVVRIPNSIGEVLATYGIYGIFLKIFFEVYFFVKTKVYDNMYALGLFIFIFIYQFTGSYLVNVAELGIWALVFMYRPEHLHRNQLMRDTA